MEVNKILWDRYSYVIGEVSEKSDIKVKINVRYLYINYELLFYMLIKIV